MPDDGLLESLLQRRLVILTGKGGVGKSTTSAALALIAAGRGKKVLLVEVDAKGNVPDFFDTRRVGFQPKRLHQTIYGLSMQPDESMREYLQIHLRVPGFSLKPLEGFIRYVSAAIPGLKEMLVTGKIAWEERARDDGIPRWDMVIVDGAPTGHVVSQLGAAQELSQLVSAGPIHDQSVWMAELFADQRRCAVVLVTIPEEMPVNETIELNGRFREETRIRPFGLIINQLQPEIVPTPLLQDFREVAVGAARNGFLKAHPDGEPLLWAGEILLDARSRADHFSELLQRSLKLPTLTIPYVFQRKHGFAFTRSLARAIAGGR
jgi:anion-transporting  ArsA/GET3 family ATPase